MAILTRETAGTGVTNNNAPLTNSDLDNNFIELVSQIDGKLPLTGNAATASKWQTGRTLTVGSTGKTVDGSTSVSWSITEIGAEYRQPNNTLRNNLGDPTVREAALFHGQFNNKFKFLAPTLQEESSDGSTWTVSTRASSAQLGDMMIGEGQGTSFSAIPSDTIGVYGGYRLTWDVVGSTGYVFLNHLYIYNSTSGNTVNVTIEALHNTNGWIVIAGPLSGNNWPGHFSIPHNTITYSNNASQHSQVRITFSTTHPTNTNAFTLYGIEWFGGYPAGKRNVESYDRNKNVTFPANISTSSSLVSKRAIADIIKQPQGQVTANTSTTTLDFSVYGNFYINISTNTTLSFSNLSSEVGSSGYIFIKQDATGGRTITLPSQAKTPGGRTISQITTASSLSVITYYVVDANTVIVNYIADFK